MPHESIPLETSKNKPLNPEALAQHQKKVKAYEELAPAMNPANPVKMETKSNIGPLLLQEYLAQRDLSPRARETFEMLTQKLRQQISENPRMANKLAKINFDERITEQLLSSFEKIYRSAPDESNEKEYYLKMYTQLEDALTNIINQKTPDKLDRAA